MILAGSILANAFFSIAFPDPYRRKGPLALWLFNRLVQMMIIE